MQWNVNMMMEGEMWELLSEELFDDLEGICRPLIPSEASDVTLVLDSISYHWKDHDQFLRIGHAHSRHK